MQFEKNIKENIGNNLSRLRERKNLTQTEMAGVLTKEFKVALTRSNIAAYETKAAVPKIEALYAYARFFRCSIDYLVTDVDTRKEEVYVMEATLKQWVEKYSEALDGYRFYKTLCSKMLQEVQNADKEQQEGKPYKPMMERLRKVHSNLVMERDPGMRNFIKAHFEPEEKIVYEAAHAGKSLHEIGREIDKEEKMVLDLLEKANAKIGNYIDALSL